MESIKLSKYTSLGYDFIPPEFLPAGEDEYYLRDTQCRRPVNDWRHLKSYEIERLVKNGNTSENWDEILVTDSFMPSQIKNSEFFGRVRIGRLQMNMLEHHDLQIPTGITNSRIIACDLGDDVAIHNVRYLGHYVIGDRCLLMNIDEMHTTHYAKFGNGILKQGEPEKIRNWLELINETGSRQVIPFDGMLVADAYLWAKYRDDTQLQQKLLTLTRQAADPRRGFYGTVGEQTIIKNCRVLKDVRVGAHGYIKGANKLKNLTINSSAAEPTQIGEGVELVNGIIGLGCHIFYGCKAVRFILGNNCNLKYGARLIHSFLGDNSTISCCEVLNSLIFPAHEQHHNNSFLIAAVVMGQSNLAAGATVGSNHNSRANDNEIQAGRGFWPGLCTSVKHSSRFASFILLAKGDYPAEMDIPLPFSLLNNNTADNRLEVLPAFWWTYNMYALARNTWKFQNRDKRLSKLQHIEFDCLAPDTIEEILQARRLLELWTATAYLKNQGADPQEQTEQALLQQGQSLLAGPAAELAGLQVTGPGLEKTSRPVVILRFQAGYHAYRQMLHYYAVRNCLAYLEQHPREGLLQMAGALAGNRETGWVNLGGQLIPEPEVDRLRAEIGNGRLASWAAVHERYDELWAGYLLARQQHAYAVLCLLSGSTNMTHEMWYAALDEAVVIQEYIRDQVYLSRKKDYDNPFRRATYRSQAEMTAAIGTAEDNGFVLQIRGETEQFRQLVAAVKQQG